MSESGLPYKNIGSYLKKKRELLSESLAEVSGAIEIDMETLVKIETGEILPSEDILALLISYFDIEPKEAKRLLDLAGYDFAKPSQEPLTEEQLSKQILAILPIDNRVLYADKTNIQMGENGITINFLQQGSNGQLLPAARVGLSRSHTKKLIKLLDQALMSDKKTQKLLPNKTQSKK